MISALTGGWRPLTSRKVGYIMGIYWRVISPYAANSMVHTASGESTPLDFIRHHAQFPQFWGCQIARKYSQDVFYSPSFASSPLVGCSSPAPSQLDSDEPPRTPGSTLIRRTQKVFSERRLSTWSPRYGFCEQKWLRHSVELIKPGF